VLAVVAQLRRAGLNVGFSYERKGLTKQLKAANQRGAAFAVIVGQELVDANELVVKDLATSRQRRVRRDALINELKR